ncbi:MAG: hypothetical protein ACRDT6_16265 [Micromonosporaceae bacterium]
MHPMLRRLVTRSAVTAVVMLAAVALTPSSAQASHDGYRCVDPSGPESLCVMVQRQFDPYSEKRGYATAVGLDGNKQYILRVSLWYCATATSSCDRVALSDFKYASYTDTMYHSTVWKRRVSGCYRAGADLRRRPNSAHPYQRIAYVNSYRVCQ